MNQHKLCKNVFRKEKFKKKMFPVVLAATPPNLVEKEQKQNKFQNFIDNSSI